MKASTRGFISKAMKSFLARAKKKRGLKRRKPKKSKIKHRVSFKERPAEAENRSKVGHFELDLVFKRKAGECGACNVSGFDIMPIAYHYGENNTLLITFFPLYRHRQGARVAAILHLLKV